MANTTTSSSALKDAITARRASLEAELKAFEGSNIDKLFSERDQLTSKLEEVDAKIAALARHVGGVPNAARPGKTPAKRGPTPGAGRKRRKRMSSADIRSRILESLTNEKQGLSQKALSEGTGIPYGTVAAYMKANASSFKATGKLKTKRYFLK